MIDQLETLLPYVPPPVVRALIVEPERWFDPVETRLRGAVLIVDLSWCPLLHGVLPRAGLEEPDAVKVELDARLGELIGACEREGGEVVRLAGGVFVAVFDPTRDGASRGDEEQRVAALVRHAARAGAAASELVSAFLESGGEPRVAVGAGEIVSCEIGGIYERWNYVVAGAAVQEAMSALRRDEEDEAGAVRFGKRARAALRAPETDAEARDAGAVTGIPEIPETIDFEAFEDAARRFVPAPVNDWMQHGLREWLTVLQPMSVLWIRVRGFAYDEQGVAEPLHRFVRELQEMIVERDGVVGELAVDGAGTLLWALFGAPPMTRQDDALRAVRCALAIQGLIASEAWQEAGLGGTLGVATGAVFAGPVGTKTRREYAVAGRGVRRARNLMLMARDGEVLCDGETYRQIRHRVACDVLPATRLQGGDDEEVAVYRPYRQLPSQPRVREVIIGRMTERVFFAERLGQLQRGAGGGAIVVEGDAGIGKSRLVKDLLRQAEVAGVRTLAGGADALEQTTAYQGWREVFGALLGIAGLKTPERRRARVIAQLQEIADYVGQAGGPTPEIVGHAPLLNDVVELDFPDNELTAQMSGAVRASNTRVLLRRLLEISVLRGYRVVVLEDAHWLDSASWALALDVVRHVRPILLVISTRPREPSSGAFAQLQTMPGTRSLRLGPVSGEEIKTMVCRRLGVAQLPTTLESLIIARAGGHPMFGEELAYALRDAGVIEVRGGECRVVEGASLEAAAAELPSTISGLIAHRVEQLSSSHQLTLKTASVIGRVFSLEALREVHPVASDKPHLLGQLATLAALDITPLETPDPERSYRFKHTITREVAYSLLQPTQRRQVHTAMAEWLESRHADDSAPIYPLLVYHWRRAADVWRTIIYLESAGEQALERGAHQEAIWFLGQLIELTSPRAEGGRGRRRRRLSAAGLRGARPLAVEKVRRARWERMLGQAHLGLGDVVEGRQRLARSLAVLGYPLPRSTGRRALGLVRQGLTQLRRRAWAPGGARPRRSASREALLDAARTYADLVMIHALVGEHGSVPYSTLMSVNLAEAAGGTSSVLIEGYAMMGVLAAGMGWRGIAEDYARKAEEGARARVDDLACQGSAWMTLGLYRLGDARWGEAAEMLEASIRARETLGALRLGETLSIYTCLLLLRGEFARARALSDRLLEFGRHVDSQVYETWALGWRAIERLEQDDFAAARELTGAWWSLLEGRADRISGLAYHAHAALLELRERGPGAARAEFRRAVALAERVSPMTPVMLVIYRSLAEVALALWESDGSQTARRRARAACVRLREFAAIFPVGLPAAAMWEGVFEWLSGSRGRALETWRRALGHARRLGMSYDEALIHRTVARRGPGPARRDHLESARALFEALGHASGLEQIRGDLERR